jgi:restriction system protein
MTKVMSRSRQLAAKVTFCALEILVEKGGEAAGRDVILEIEKRVDLDDWDKEVYEKSGYTRWKSILHFFTIDLIKSGFLVKNKGVWFITTEGQAAIKLGEVAMLEKATEGYDKWREANPKNDKKLVTSIVDDIDIGSDELIDTVNEQAQEATIQQMEQIAIDGLRQQINSKNAYEFQDLVAALLRGMNYYTPFVAPKGKDGGIDVIAYQDPLGVKSPRIKVQIKHRESTANVSEIRELMGLLQKEGDVGLFISTGGFTSDAKTTARSSHVHVELIDFDRFIALWQEFYQKFNDEDKDRLRLRPVYFYEPAI